jgi:hypothetical protein
MTSKIIGNYYLHDIYKLVLDIISICYSNIYSVAFDNQILRF